jgi:glycosyltransferase involved in cell wall biosynthesis
LNRFTSITCPSLELKTLIENWGVKRPIEFIANGIVPIENKKIEKQFDVISVCRLVTWKNLDKLIFACAKANCTLAIVGSGSEELKLKSLANSLGAKVTFFGQLGEPEVINCLQKSKVFALLSDYEGLSFSLLQAMASELPVIVSNVRGNTDVISDGKDGIVVDLKDEESILIAIKSLLSSNEKIDTLGKGALKKVQRDYLQENQINKVIALLSRGKLP